MANAFRRATLHVARSSFTPRTVRWALMTACGIKAQTRAIAARSVFTGPAVKIGRGSYINRDCLFDASAQITIGDGVEVGMGVLLATSSHHLGPAQHRAGPLYSEPVTIGDGAWIGARAVVLPGVTVGPGVVIAAGAVVVRDCEPGHVYAGVPARQVKDID